MNEAIHLITSKDTYGLWFMAILLLSTSCTSPFSVRGCPVADDIPNDIIDVDLYEAGAAYDAIENRLGNFYLNGAKHVRGFSSSAFIDTYDEENVVLGENVRCLAGANTSGSSMSGEHVDSIVYAGAAIVEMESLSGDFGCGTITFKSVVLGPVNEDFAIQLTGPGSLECYGEPADD